MSTAARGAAHAVRAFLVSAAGVRPDVLVQPLALNDSRLVEPGAVGLDDAAMLVGVYQDPPQRIAVELGGGGAGLSDILQPVMVGLRVTDPDPAARLERLDAAVQVISDRLDADRRLNGAVDWCEIVARDPFDPAAVGSPDTSIETLRLNCLIKARDLAAARA